MKLSMNKIIGIYKITSPSDSIYIGQSNDVNRRKQAYIRVDEKLKAQPKIYNSLKKYGWDNHTFEIIEECEFEQLNTRERYWQDFYDVLDRNKGLNCVLTNTDELPSIRSQETNEKISKTLKMRPQRKHPCLENKHREESIEKMKVSSKGKNAGEKHHNYGKYGFMSSAFGFNHTEKFKKDMSNRQKGGDNHSSILIMDVTTGIFFYCIKEASIAYGINYDLLLKMLRNKRPNKTNLIRC